MKINKKYKPLFDLLICWKVLEDFKKKPPKTEKEIKRYEYFKQLNNVRTVFILGGRNSGKTWTIARFNGIAMVDYNHRILYTRYTMSSTDNSITTALRNGFNDLGFGENEYKEIGNDFYANTNYPYSPRITITGQKTSSNNQTAKLKSIEEYSIFITDEAEELKNLDDWNKIVRSIRAKDVKTINIVSFNPTTKEHFLYTTFYEDLPSGFNGIIDDRLYIHTTYLDLEEHTIDDRTKEENKKLKENYDLINEIPIHLREQHFSKKQLYDYKDYHENILGNFKSNAEGCIYPNWEEGEFIDNGNTGYGMDFGVNDPTTCVKVSVDNDKKIIYAHEVFGGANLNNNQIIDLLNSNTPKDALIVGDSEDKRLINELRKADLNIIKSDKHGYANISNRIRSINNYKIVVTKDSYNLKKELNNYVFHDKKANLPLENGYDHYINALEYISLKLMRKNNIVM